MKRKKSIAAHDPPMGRKELAGWAGICLDCVDKYIRDPEDPLPCLRFGRKFLFQREEVLAWCRRRAQETLTRAAE